MANEPDTDSFIETWLRAAEECDELDQTVVRVVRDCTEEDVLDDKTLVDALARVEEPNHED